MDYVGLCAVYCASVLAVSSVLEEIRTTLKPRRLVVVAPADGFVFFGFFASVDPHDLADSQDRILTHNHIRYAYLAITKFLTIL